MMFKITLRGKRFNNKTYPTYEEARKAVRRIVTKRIGRYVDSYTGFGFHVEKIV